MKRFLGLLATGALALGISSVAQAQGPRTFSSGSLQIDDNAAPTKHTITIATPANPSAEYTAWQNSGFSAFTFNVPVPPAAGAQSGFLYAGPLPPTPQVGLGATGELIPYWLWPGQAGFNNNGGSGGAWDYATPSQLNLVTTAGLAPNQPVRTNGSSQLTNGPTNLAGGATEITGILPALNGGTGINGSAAANGNILIGNGTGYTLAPISGTANQVIVTNGAGTITLSTPQNINTAATPTFASETLNAATNQLTLGNAPATTTISATAPLAARTYTLPDAGGPANFILSTSTAGQTIGGGITVTGGESLSGGLNNNTGGITAAGTITGGTGITSSGAIAFTGLTANGLVGTGAGGVLNSTHLTDGQLMIGVSAGSPTAGTLTGTANQVNVTNGAGTITLSTPQNINTAATPTFAAETLTNATNQLTLGTGPATVTISSTAPGAARTYTLPDAGGAANFILSNSTAGQTINGGVTVNGGESLSGGLNNNTGGVTNAGAISGATTIAASGNISSTGGILNIGTDAASAGKLTMHSATVGANKTGTIELIPSGAFTAANRTYDFPDASGVVSLGGIVNGTTNNSTLRWDAGTTTWTENANVLSTAAGNVTANAGFNANSAGITNAGPISGGTAITSSGAITFSGLTANGSVGTGAGGVLTSTHLTDGQLMIGVSAGAPTAGTIAGTANQVIVTNGAGTITLSTPQNIHTAATPTFAAETLTNATNQLTLGTAGHVDVISATAPAAVTQTYTIPDAGASTNFILGASTAGQTIAGGLTVTGGETLSGGLNNNTGGITNAGAISGGTAITSSGAITFSGLTANGSVGTGAGGVLTSTHLTDGQLMIGVSAGAPTAGTITGTANRVTVTNGAGTITLSGPQDIATTSTPTFAAETLTNATNQLTLGTAGHVDVISATAPAAVTQTYTIPDAGASTNFILGASTAGQTIAGGLTVNGGLTLGTPLTVPNGGTGVNTLTSNAVLLGNGAGNVAATNVGTNGQVLIGGTTTPAFGTITLGTTGADVNFATGNNTLQLNVPDAAAAARGVVNTTTQTFSGDKTFTTAATGATPITSTTTGIGEAITANNGAGVGFPQGVTMTVTNTGTGSARGLTANVTGVASAGGAGVDGGIISATISSGNNVRGLASSATTSGAGTATGGDFSSVGAGVGASTALKGTASGSTASNIAGSFTSSGAGSVGVQISSAATDIKGTTNLWNVTNAGVGTFAGLTMNGALNMNTHLINNVVDPVAAQDAATKNYVDNGILGTVILAPATTARNTVTPTADVVPLTLKGFAPGTADLLDLQAPGGAIVAKVAGTTGIITAANGGAGQVTLGTSGTNEIAANDGTLNTTSNVNTTGSLTVGSAGQFTVTNLGTASTSSTITAAGDITSTGGNLVSGSTGPNVAGHLRLFDAANHQAIVQTATPLTFATQTYTINNNPNAATSTFALLEIPQTFVANQSISAALQSGATGVLNVSNTYTVANAAEAATGLSVSSIAASAVGGTNKGIVVNAANASGLTSDNLAIEVQSGRVVIGGTVASGKNAMDIQAVTSGSGAALGISLANANGIVASVTNQGVNSQTNSTTNGDYGVKGLVSSTTAPTALAGQVDGVVGENVLQIAIGGGGETADGNVVPAANAYRYAPSGVLAHGKASVTAGVGQYSTALVVKDGAFAVAGIQPAGHITAKNFGAIGTNNTIKNPLCTADSYILLTPASATAATAELYVSSTADGSFIVTNAAVGSGAADANFNYFIINPVAR